MLREASVAGILMLVLLTPGAPALPPACDATLAIEESLQSDADSGDDAPDTPDAPLRIPHDDYYWAYLSVLDQSTSDLEDWYVFEVVPGTSAVMANVIVAAPGIAYEAYLPDAAQRFYLTLIAPDGASQTVSSAGGVARFVDPAVGDHLIRVWTLPSVAPYACASPGADAGLPGTPIVRNHGLYVGCNPFCAPAPHSAR